MSENLLAVADGVGGWASKGIDPGIFARELCGHVLHLFTEQRSKGVHISQISLLDILSEGLSRTKAIGSSTFCMASLDEDGDKVNALNLGDSGYIILRPDPK